MAAFDNNGFSEVATFKIGGKVCDTPTGQRAQIEADTEVSIEWDAVDGVEAYDVSIKAADGIEKTRRTTATRELFHGRHNDSHLFFTIVVLETTKEGLTQG